MKKISPQTKSFVILFTIAIIGCYLSFFTYRLIEAGPKDPGYLLKDRAQRDIQAIQYSSNKYNSNKNPVVQPVSEVQDITPAVDTSNWKTYKDKKYNFSFKYDPTWKILPPRVTDSFYVVEINPGKKYYPTKISVSDKGFFAVEGLPTKEETINGYSALNINNLLYGIQNGDYYYTFDLGWSLNLKPQFNALVHSVVIADKTAP